MCVGDTRYICVSSGPLVLQGDVTHCSVEALWESDHYSFMDQGSKQAEVWVGH